MEIHQICKILKETRREKKITLKEASQLTKLAPLIIKKIEEADNLESISQFYLKGFLKIYATFLGRKDLIGEIENCFLEKPSSPLKKTIKKEPPKIKRIEELSRLWPSSKKVKNIVLLVLIGVGGLFSLFFFLRPKPEKAPPSVVKEISSAPKVISKKKLAKPFVNLLTKGKVFIEVKTDGKLVFSGILLAGNKENWQAKEKIEIKISNPSLVVLELSGELIPTSNLKKPTSYIVDSSGFKVKE
ncbi:MAG TPA: DUF4115 domain-containing protein [Candidatus Omnitrophica bacterium]|nr:MAG: hypothetical protein DRP61_02605 [Candidatus Omnitrophota bacterium]RKY34998.1 MAG: hypothetical protein DRP69_03015 [Candidatus Omnitrophota bacterium]RKY44153.1 MAG: hypothetical protein DRP80_03155 [Candidatus Omnitrophota bacterium]HEC69155.1 DUF4115 domain-containing protein [Candidatus Omnitrophota bacterium]